MGRHLPPPPQLPRQSLRLPRRPSAAPPVLMRGPNPPLRSSRRQLVTTSGMRRGVQQRGQQSPPSVLAREHPPLQRRLCLRQQLGFKLQSTRMPMLPPLHASDTSQENARPLEIRLLPRQIVKAVCLIWSEGGRGGGTIDVLKDGMQPQHTYHAACHSLLGVARGSNILCTLHAIFSAH